MSTGAKCFVCSLLIWGGCEDSTTADTPEWKTLYSTSFELNGVPSADGWDIGPPYLGFSTEAPPDGGKYSIYAVSSRPGGVASLVLPAPEGSNIYQLSLWGKYSFIEGGIRFHLRTPGRDIFGRPFIDSLRKWLIFSDTAWTEYHVLDTLTTSSGDSLLIQLIAGLHEYVGMVFLDLVELKAQKR